MKRVVAFIALGVLAASPLPAFAAANAPESRGAAGVARVGPATSLLARVPGLALGLTSTPDAKIAGSSPASGLIIPAPDLVRLTPDSQEKLAVVLTRSQDLGLWQIKAAAANASAGNLPMASGQGHAAAPQQAEVAAQAAAIGSNSKFQEIIEGVLAEFSLKTLQTMPQDQLGGVLQRLVVHDHHLDHHGQHDHDHGHGAGHVCPSHAHSHGGSLNLQQLTATRKAVAINGVFVLIEVVGAMITGSAALLADAAHNGIDVGLIAALLVCAALEAKAKRRRAPFNWQRAQATISLVVTGAILLTAFGAMAQAIDHLAVPVAVPGAATLILALGALLANSITTLILYPHAGHSVGLKSITLHYFVDAIGSLGIIASSALMLWSGWSWPDPVMGFLIFALILWISVPLAVNSVKLLLERSRQG